MNHRTDEAPVPNPVSGAGRLRRPSPRRSLGLAACATGLREPAREAASAPARLSAATGATLQGCEALPSQFNFAQTRLDSATAVAAGPMVPDGPRRWRIAWSRAR